MIKSDSDMFNYLNFLKCAITPETAKFIYEQSCEKTKDLYYLYSYKNKCSKTRPVPQEWAKMYGNLVKYLTKPNYLLLPLDLETKRICEDGFEDELSVEHVFLISLISHLIPIMMNDYFVYELYESFKYRFFLPILDSELSRMTKENINYTKEKPFIVCFESALSRMLNDERYMSNLKSMVHKSFFKKIKNFKLVFYMFNKEEEIVTNGVSQRLPNYKAAEISIKKLFKAINHNKNAVKSNGDMLNHSDMIFIRGLDVHFNNIREILNYFIKLTAIRCIKNEAKKDIRNNNSLDDVFEKIKDELYIFNSRNAKVFGDYLDNFTKHSKSTLFYDFDSSMIIPDAEIKKAEYEAVLATGDETKYRQPTSSFIAGTTAGLYSLLSSIESMNRDYTKENSVYAIDASQLRESYESIVSSLNGFLDCRYSFIDYIYSKKDIVLKAIDFVDKNVTILNVANRLFDWLWLLIKTGNITDKRIIDNIGDCKDRLISFKDCKSPNSEEVENIHKIISILLSTKENDKFVEDLLLENVSCIGNMRKYLDDINIKYNIFVQHVEEWKAIMNNNKQYFQFFNPIKEFEEYVNNMYSRDRLCYFYTYKLDNEIESK